jgi:hypothetical protein
MHCFALLKFINADQLRDSRYYQLVAFEYRSYIAATKKMHTKSIKITANQYYNVANSLTCTHLWKKPLW